MCKSIIRDLLLTYALPLFRAEGVGKGAIVEIINTAFEYAISLPDLFIDHNDYKVPKLKGFESIPTERRAQFKAAGFLTLCILIRFGIAPLPISPIFLWFLLDGMKGLCVDLPFFRVAHAEAFKQLSALEGRTNFTQQGLTNKLNVYFGLANLTVSYPS